MLDFKMPGMDTPEGQGLLAAAFSLLQARKMPGDRGIGGALGAAGQQYMGARSQAQEQMQRRKLQDLQMKGQQLNLDQAEQARQREQAALALRAQYQRPEGFDYNGYAQALAASDPMAALDLKERLGKKRAPIPVAPGTGLVDPETFQPVYTQPERPQAPEKDPEAIRSLKIIYGDGTPAYQAALQRLGAKTTTHQPGTKVEVNNVTKQEGEESKAVGKFFGDAYADTQKAGFDAESKTNRYNRLGQLLEGVNTGTFTPTGLEVAKAAAALGVNIDPNMQNKEAAQALSSEIALQLRNPSGGAGMPGAMSDADRQFLANMVPGLATTPEGRKLMIETATKLAQRDKEVAAMARKYRQKKGNIDEGFYDELAQFSAEKPLFGKATTKAPQAMPTLPPAQQHKGRVVRDTATGKQLKSNGMTWVEVK